MVLISAVCTPASIQVIWMTQRGWSKETTCCARRIAEENLCLVQMARDSLALFCVEQIAELRAWVLSPCIMHVATYPEGCCKLPH